MYIIEIEVLPNGAHRNQAGTFETIPEGWAVIPDNIEMENFPFGEVTVEKINGVMTVTKWIAGTIPESETPTEETPKTDAEKIKELQQKIDDLQAELSALKGGA